MLRRRLLALTAHFLFPSLTAFRRVPRVEVPTLSSDRTAVSPCTSVCPHSLDVVFVPVVSAPMRMSAADDASQAADVSKMTSSAIGLRHHCHPRSGCSPQPSLLTTTRYFHGSTVNPQPLQGRADASVIPSSTTLTIGDVAVPIPDYVRHPQFVAWTIPTSDHSQQMLRCATDSSSSDSCGVADRLRLPPPLLDGNSGNMFFSLSDPLTRSYLRWMAQKEMLGQDMCIMGSPGPAMRWLVLLYSCVTHREVRIVTLNRDVNESDLKQRREIRGGTLVYEDQSVVTAAKEGQILVLEGLERVERNVLPVINNLLENREMHLENGASLIQPARYDALERDIVQEKLSRYRQHHLQSSEGPDPRDLAMMHAEAQQQLHAMGLFRVSEKFCVIGITVPVPPFEGNPLDPPLRSRFQCLHIRSPLPSVALSRGAAGCASPAAREAGRQGWQQRLEPILKLHSAVDAVNDATRNFVSEKSGGDWAPAADTAPSSSLQNMGNYELGVMIQQLLYFPDIPTGEILARSFPWVLYAAQLPHGANPTSSAGLEEVRRRLAQYAHLVAHCGLSTPLLHAENEEQDPPLTPQHFPPGSSSGNRGTGPSSRSQMSPPLRRVGDVLLSLVGIERDVQRYLRSAKRIGGSSGARTPDSVAQACNYITHIRNVRCVSIEGHDGAATGQEAAAEDASTTMVVAEAVVATASHDKGVTGAGPGYFCLPIFLGRGALPQMSGTVGEPLTIAAVCPTEKAVFTAVHYHILQSMLQLHASHRHICLIGPTGCGKTALIREFSRVLGYSSDTMHLFAEMTNKDLFQRRTTDTETGDTTWEGAALVEAAIHGGLVVLDGIDKIPVGMLASLQQILLDQSAILFDGTVLKSTKEYGLLKGKMQATDAEMRHRRIFPIHPAFRVVATSRPPGGATASSARPFVVSHDVTALFGIVSVPEADEDTLTPVLAQVVEDELKVMASEGLLQGTASPTAADVIKVVKRLLSLRASLSQLRVTDPKIPSLSFRQALHLTRWATRHPSGVAQSIASALLLPLLTGVTATQVSHAMQQCGFRYVKQQDPKAPVGGRSELTMRPSAFPGDRLFEADGVPVLRLTRIYTSTELALVPFVESFHSNPVHESILTWLGRQYAMGSNILLIGNQGVGKNKVVDTFLSRLRVPRHYLQLHRDTTVGSLTINPSVEGGLLRWEDSPLVKAVQLGHCLVVDEIDKASVEVVQVLKGLIEDREMRLADGRRIVDPALLACYSNPLTSIARMEGEGCIAIHPDFRIIVLANPPGFPFHGNDFFRECGDLFSSYVMHNPDVHSQLRVLRAYAPAIPEPLLLRLASAFQKLQEAFEQGALTYPFSLRELIAVVKHLSRFPQDGVYEALNNVFNFDARDENALRQIRHVLHHYLNPLVTAGGMSQLMPYRAGEPRLLIPQQQLLSFPFPASRASPEASEWSAEGAHVVEPFAKILPSRVVLTPTRLREAVTGTALTAESRTVHYPVSAFDPEEEEASGGGEDAFTEWVAQLRMPFLDKEADRVLAMCPVRTYGTASTSPLVSFLLERRHSAKAAPQVLLATLCMPPAPMEAHSATAALLPQGAAASWTPGDVHFLNVTTALSAVFPQWQVAQDAVVVEDFNIARHAAAFMPPSHGSGDAAAAWPPTWYATCHLQDHLRSLLGDAFEESMPPVLCLRVPSRSPQTCVLIDVMSGCNAPLGGARELVLRHHPNPSCSEPTSLEEESQAETTHVAAVLPLTLPQLVDLPSSDPAPIATSPHPVHVRATDGIVCATPHSSRVALLFQGHVVHITLPAAVAESPYFFAPQLAVVTFAEGVSGTRPQGILKVALSEGGDGAVAAHVSYSALPSGFEAGQFITQVAREDGSPTTAATRTLHPEDLRGAVWAPVRANGKGSDIAFLRVERADSAQGLQMRMYSQPSHTTTTPARLPISLTSTVGTAADPVRHQFLQTHSDGPRSMVTAVDVNAATVRTFAARPMATAVEAGPSPPLLAVNTASGIALSYDSQHQELSMADTDSERLQRHYAAWSALLSGSTAQVGNVAVADGAEVKDYQMTYSKPRKQPSGTLKHGEVDDQEHHGGNTWAGGTGGTDTAGLGGIIGPYRLDKGHQIHQVSPEEKKQVPKHIAEEAKRMGQEALRERLAAIGMSESDYASYQRLQDRVRPAIVQLRAVLMGLRAAEGERTWVRGQSDGVWDDGKIVEGIVGDKNVYKRRVDSAESNSFQQKLKKRVVFVLDVSASMYRFESMDQRLTKLLESTIMVMEAFAGFEDKIDYAMIGHNGDSDCIPLVNFGAAPSNPRERMVVCQKMIAYAQYCLSGDNTVEAMRRSIELVTAAKGDAYFVFVVSDANLRQYGITPRELTEVIRSRRQVQMFCILIATLGQQSSQIQKELPVGHGYECMQTEALPHVLRTIFTSVNLL